MKKFLQYVVVFIIIILIFNLLLLLSSLFPSSLLESNVKESSERLLVEGNFFYLNKPLNITNNNFTDAIMINECYSIDNTNPFFSYMSARKNYKKGFTIDELPDTTGELISISSSSNPEDQIYNTVGELDEFLDGKVTTSVEYARYWHGYLVFLRILLLFFNIMEIRYFLFGLFLFLFIFLFIILKRKLGVSFALIFSFALIAYNYFFVFYSLESAPIFITMMIACIVLLTRIDKLKNFYLFIFIIACISNFVDYLTVPLITLAMPLYIYIAYIFKNKDFQLRNSIKTVACSCFAWGSGYAFTWLSKWVIYDVIFHKGLIASAIQQVFYRTVSPNPIAVNTLDAVLLNFFANASIFTTIFMAFMAFAIFFISMISMLNKNFKWNLHMTSFSIYLKRIVPFVIIAILPIIWYVVLSNHTVLHFHFVYRQMLIFLVGILICLRNLFVVKKVK